MSAVVVDWREVGAKVHDTLRRRRENADEARDITQVALERALVRGPLDDGHQAVVRWATRVAVNESIDRYRWRQRWLPLNPDSAEQVGAGIEDAVVARDELARTLAALGRLRYSDREAIIAACRGDVVAAADRNRVNVQRHRARARLRAAVSP